MPETTKPKRSDSPKPTDILETKHKVPPPTIIIKNYSDLKLVSNKFDRLLFSISSEQYNELKNSLTNPPIKAYKSEKSGDTLYSLNCKPIDKNEFNQFVPHNRYDIKIGLERYSYKGRNGYSATCVMLRDLGKDQSFDQYMNDKKALMVKMLKEDE
jgi:hypothetical protein